MMAIAEVPEEITIHLSQWSKEAVARRHAKRSVVEVDSIEEVDAEVASLEPDSDTEGVETEITPQGNSTNSSVILRESAEYTWIDTCGCLQKAVKDSFTRSEFSERD